MLRKLNYYGVVFLTLPFVPLAVISGLFETALNTDSKATLFIISPFIWAVERKVGQE